MNEQKAKELIMYISARMREERHSPFAYKPVTKPPSQKIIDWAKSVVADHKTGKI